MSVVVPTFNEENGIERCVTEVRRWLEEKGADWEILVVDNASTDATVKRLAPMLTDDRLTLLRNERNGGKGFSVRRGMLAARGELRLLCDADCWQSLPSLDRMVERSHSSDVVIGSRLAHGADVKRAQPLARRLAGAAFLRLTRAIMSEPASDVFCGFKLWRAAAADDVFSRATIDDWAFDAEVLALARRLGYSAVESGITWAHRGESRLSMARTALPALRDLMRARRAAWAVSPSSAAPSQPPQRPPARPAQGATPAGPPDSSPARSA